MYTIQQKRLYFIIISTLLTTSILVGVNSLLASDNADNHIVVDETDSTDIAMQPEAMLPGAQVWLRLMIDGNDIDGGSETTTLGRENTIELISYAGGFAGQTFTDKPRAEPVVVLKMIDQTSPLLIKAVGMNEPVDIAEFMFFRTTPSGAGTVEHYYTVTLESGRISYLRQFEFTADSGISYMVEEVVFLFSMITYTYELSGATYTYVMPSA